MSKKMIKTVVFGYIGIGFAVALVLALAGNGSGGLAGFGKDLIAWPVSVWGAVA